MAEVFAAPPAELTVGPHPPVDGFRGDPAAVRLVGVGDDPDPLVDVPAELDPRIHYDDLPLPARGGPLLRREVVARLRTAGSSLPSGFALTVVDGWRSPEFQEALLAYYRERLPELTDGYVSDPLDPALVAPHTTGGAVDLTLSWRGQPLALGTDYDAFEAAAHTSAFEEPGADQQIRDLRRLLGRCLRAVGFSPYPWEWWHWSYGDQWWALDHGLERSLYGRAEPGPPAA